MTGAAQTVTVSILGKEYQIACPVDEVESLTQAARFLDKRMAEIRNSGKVVGLDRIAVMAALNITHELLVGETTASAQSQDMGSRLDKLNERLSSALEEHKS